MSDLLQPSAHDVAWEAGFLRRLRGEPEPERSELGAAGRLGWRHADDHLRSMARREVRAAVVRLEHDARVLEQRAIDEQSIGRHIESEEALELQRAIEAAASWMRREWLREEEPDPRRSAGEAARR